MRDDSRESGQLRYLAALIAALFAGLLLYSQTGAFSWDEGFHLLAAQLIMRGQRPYLDFCFPQTPFNAYLTAAWMRIFGDTWRAVHVLETTCVAAAALLAADFIRSRFPVPSWRLAAALATAIAVAMNSQVVIYGTIGQSYGLSLFLLVAAYRLAVSASEHPGASRAAAAGFAAAAAAASSLLTAPAGPVLLIWILLRGGSGRFLKVAAYLAGAAVAFLPLVWLYHQGPQQTLFNLLFYQLHYRHNWTGATNQDISALTSWIDSAQGLSLGLLAAAGMWLVHRRSDWEAKQRDPFYLSFWLAVGLAAELGLAHPTFERYFLLVVPFVAIPAMAGLYAVGSRLAGEEHPLRAAYSLIFILSLGLARALYQDSDSYSWKDVEKISQQVEQVTAPGAPVWADELIYFVLRRPPPDGMEFAYAHEIEQMPAEQAARLHILTAADLRRRAAAGEYKTVAACYDTENTDAANVPALYRRKATIRDCTVYWDFGR